MSSTRSRAPSTFSSVEWLLACGLAVLVEAGLAALLVLAKGTPAVAAQAEAAPREIPIEVMPVLDEVPLLKLGGKKVKQKLPDMWRKPKPKKRYEDKSAPAPNAEKKKLEKPPKNELAKSDETPAPEDAELAKKVDEEIPEEEEPTEDPNLPEEGSSDGVKGGTETDPLKAHVVSQYRIKITSWFKAGYVVPTNEIDCSTLQGLSAKVSAVVGSDRSVTSYELTSPSGNAIFDARVRAHMDRKVGQQLPPPPPKYPDILDVIVRLNFSGKTPKCKDKTPDSPGEESPGSSPPEAEPTE